jgi:hypothetical protein
LHSACSSSSSMHKVDTTNTVIERRSYTRHIICTGGVLRRNSRHTCVPGYHTVVAHSLQHATQHHNAQITPVNISSTASLQRGVCSPQHLANRCSMNFHLCMVWR